MNLLGIIPGEKEKCQSQNLAWFILFNLFKILENQQNFRNGGKISGCQRLRSRWRQKGSGCGFKRTTQRILCGDGNVLYLDCIDVKILVLIVHYSSARYYHWKTLDKGYMGSLYITHFTNIFKFYFIWLWWVLVVAHRIFHLCCDMQDL